ncbi:MAG: 50S ribosomal protein L24, partial [Lachnospiraceae bacterium]|nr:50S ribosomal protein L24 [Lachnospiraceae bacterium]
VCPKCKKPVRTGVEMKDGKKIRVCKKCGAAL